MSKNWLRHACCITLVLCAALMNPHGTFAQSVSQDDNKSIPEDVGIIDQIINVTFEPFAVFLLQETGLGYVRQYQAAAVELIASGAQSAGSRQLIVGAPVVMEGQGNHDNILHFTFFMAGQNAAFAATEVKNWSVEQLRNGTINLHDLLGEIAQLENILRVKRVENLNLEESLASLRKQASEIAEIGQIVKLKMELKTLSNAYKEKEEEAERLRSQIDLGRQVQDPEGIDQYRLELSLHLQEAAKVTAIADRLSKRQQEAARQNFMRKIGMVKEMDTSDPRELAKEVLQLRKQRRELENRLGITSTDAYSDEF
jgi:hypothetical protein